MKQRIIAKKKEEMRDYMGEVKGPPQSVRAARPRQNAAGLPGRKCFPSIPVPGAINLIFVNYALPGDKMDNHIRYAAKKITSLNINTYMGEEKDAVTLNVRMATLPDGTNYSEQTVLNAEAKKLVVTTTNSNYQKL